MNNVLVLGATSSLAQAIVDHLPASKLFLVARNAQKLADVQRKLSGKGSNVETLVCDLASQDGMNALFQWTQVHLKQIDVLLMAHGTLSKQAQANVDLKYAEAEVQTNFVSPVLILTHFTGFFERQRHGSIMVISSVAGDRGRQSNYLYGACKGGLSHFLEGLRNHLHPFGVHVMTIKAGFVRTPMTEHLQLGRLAISPAQFGASVNNALRRRRAVAYVPWYWRCIMQAIKMIPEGLFKRLKF